MKYSEKAKLIKGQHGSSCPKKFLALSKEYSPKGICIASRKYQNLQIEELKKDAEMTLEEFKNQKNEITEKACLCVGLANPAYLENDIEIKGEDQGVVICPGPNLAYFDKEVSLSQMLQHIYGNANILAESYRPNMFINELKMYVDYFKKNASESLCNMTASEQKKWRNFRQNILDGIAYYENMFKTSSFFQQESDVIDNELQNLTLLLTL